MTNKLCPCHVNPDPVLFSTNTFEPQAYIFTETSDKETKGIVLLRAFDTMHILTRMTTFIKAELYKSESQINES